MILKTKNETEPNVSNSYQHTSQRTRSREALVNLVPQLIQNVLTVDVKLPARIVEAHAFGSVFRKTDPHDLDILLLHEQDREQQNEWRRFRYIFSTGHGGVRDDPTVGLWIKASFDLHNALDKYNYRPDLQKLTLSDALRQPEVQSVAKRTGLNTLWAGCFSWTHYLHGEHGDGMFIADLEKIFRTLVVGRLAQKGLQVHFMEKSAFGKSGFKLNAIDASTYVKVWDRNTLPGEVAQVFAKHYSDAGLHGNELKSLRQQVNDELSELEKKIAKLEKIVAKRKLNIPLRRLFLKLSPAETSCSDKQLQEKSTEMREMLKHLRATDDFLGSLEVILGWGERITLATLTCDLLGGFNSSEENTRRALCRNIGLPEHEVVIDRTRGGRGTYAREAIYTRSEKKRSQIAAEGDRYEKAHKLELRIRHMLPDSKWYARVNLVSDEKKLPIRIGGTYSRHVERETTGPVARLLLTYNYPDSYPPFSIRKEENVKLDVHHG